MKTHFLSLIVKNNPGVLARICLLFAQRGYNIASLSVYPTKEDESLSKIKLSVIADEATLEQIINQSLKLVEVLSASLTSEKIILKEEHY